MAQQLPDLYAVLGVPHDASDEDIKRAYRRLARELHPDVNADPAAEQRFKEVVAAYETLSDPQRRRQYDTYGQAGVPADFFPFADLGDLFDVFFGGGRRRPQRRSRTQRGEDAFVQLDLTFEEAAFGVEREVQIDLAEACPRCGGNGCEPGTSPATCTRCGGTGQIQEVARSIFGTMMTARPCPTCEATGTVIPSPCTQCAGGGRVRERRSVRVEVPAGVADGMELRVSGAGHAGVAGGPPGDFFVTLRVASHPVFERRGQDLVATLTVPMTQAALGAELRVPTLDGEEVVKLGAGTRSGAVLRLKHRGLPNLGRRGRGDLYLTVDVETPEPRSRTERRLLEELADERGERVAKGSPSTARLAHPAS